MVLHATIGQLLTENADVPGFCNCSVPVGWVGKTAPLLSVGLAGDRRRLGTSTSTHVWNSRALIGRRNARSQALPRAASSSNKPMYTQHRGYRILFSPAKRLPSSPAMLIVVEAFKAPAERSKSLGGLGRIKHRARQPKGPTMATSCKSYTAAGKRGPGSR